MCNITATILIADPKGSVIKEVVVSTVKEINYYYEAVRYLVAIVKRDYKPMEGHFYGRMTFKTSEGNAICQGILNVYIFLELVLNYEIIE